MEKIVKSLTFYHHTGRSIEIFIDTFGKKYRMYIRFSRNTGRSIEISTDTLGKKKIIKSVTFYHHTGRVYRNFYRHAWIKIIAS